MVVSLYILCSLIWISVFYAFMQKNRPDDIKYGSNDYWSFGNWKNEYFTLFIIGAYIWWATILVLIFIKLANKYLFNK